MESCAIRLRIYGTQRFSKRLIGEVKMPLSKLDLTSPLADEQIWKNLNPKGLVVSIHVGQFFLTSRAGRIFCVNRV